MGHYDKRMKQEVLETVPAKDGPAKESHLDFFIRYAAAVSAVVVGLALRSVLSGVLGATVPYITFFPAVMFAAWFGGLGPGILATLLSLFVTFYVVISPGDSLDTFNSANLAGGAMFIGVCAFISILNEALRRSRARSEDRLQALTVEHARRGRAESALAESRDQLQTTLASIGDAVIATDAEANITFLNEVAQKLTGWSQADAAGRPISDVFIIRNEQTLQPVESPVQKALREGVVVGLANHTVLIHRDGSVTPIEDSAAPIRDQAQRTLGVVLVFRDVAERRKSEDLIARSEERLTLALDAGKIGVWDWDIAANRIEWSDMVYDIHGVERGQFAGTVEDFGRLVHPEDHPRVAEAIQEALKKGTPYDVDFRVIHPNGSVHWVSTTAQVYRNENGAPVRMLGATTDVTSRKQAETNLLQQWRTFDTALSHSPDFTYTFDLEGHFTYVNKALLSLWQLPLEHARGKNFFELQYPPELAGRLQSQIQEVIETQAPVRDTTPFTGPTGETRFYDYIFVPVVGADGMVEAVAGSTRDITQQKQAEDLIEEDRRRWRELLLRAPAVVAGMRGPEHRFEWVNKDCVQLLGRPENFLTGKSVREALPEMINQGYVDMLDAVYRTGEAHSAREALVSFDRNGDGILQSSYLNFVCLATRGNDGQIDGTFVHATDVTDLVKARQQIEESEARYRFLAESIPHMVWTATPDGALDYVSGQVAAYFGMRPETLLGAGWLAGVHPDDKDGVVQRWQHSLTTGEPYEAEFRLHRDEDGAWRWFLVRARSMPAPEGKVICWVGTCTDIHDQKESEAALRRANRELEEFSYVASHDLQEPLRMVNIYTQLMLKQLGSGDETLNQHAGIVRKGVNRMEALIRDLLTFSRTVHTDELPVGIADLSSAWQEALSVMKERIEEAGASISADALPVVRGDTSQMAHVFQNLLSNALKYRKDDFPPEIQLRTKQTGDEWIVSVRDNGIGFAPQYAERIFGLFKRLHKDEYPGTGLGLAICKRIVERYGGRMWAEAELDVGATFYFALPKAEGQ